MPRKSTNIETPPSSLSNEWHEAMNAMKWTEYAIRCQLFDDEKLRDITLILSEYAKEGKKKAFK